MLAKESVASCMLLASSLVAGWYWCWSVCDWWLHECDGCLNGYTLNGVFVAVVPIRVFCILKKPVPGTVIVIYWTGRDRR